MRILPPKIENNLRVGVIFYCKDCERVVGVTPVGRKFVYRCNICKTKNVAFGSDKSIKNFYHIKEEPVAEVAAAAVGPTAAVVEKPVAAPPHVAAPAAVHQSHPGNKPAATVPAAPAPGNVPAAK